MPAMVGYLNHWATAALLFCRISMLILLSTTVSHLENKREEKFVRGGGELQEVAYTRVPFPPKKRSWTRGQRVTSSSLIPLKTHRVERLMYVKSVVAQASYLQCSVEVKRGGCQLRCRPRHLTKIQNYEVYRQTALA
ncbi:hypothetical protein TNCV_956951 [Trichonephila clavipes]|nr:hypothetical protein TNCV_956951 [Trichonephila clavipes]